MLLLMDSLHVANLLLLLLLSLLVLSLGAYAALGRLRTHGPTKHQGCGGAGNHYVLHAALPFGRPYRPLRFAAKPIPSGRPRQFTSESVTELDVIGLRGILSAASRETSRTPCHSPGLTCLRRTETRHILCSVAIDGSAQALRTTLHQDESGKEPFPMTTESSPLSPIVGFCWSRRVTAAIAVALAAATVTLAQGVPPTDEHVGDLFGDLIHIKRNAITGQPILQKRLIEMPGDVVDWGYCPIPVDAAGLEIPFAPLSCDPDPAFTSSLIEVDYFGRLSAGRTKERNQRMHFDEVIVTIKEADVVQLDAANRFLLGFDCSAGQCDRWKTIDSPQENLSLYRWLMKYGHLQTDPSEVDTSPGGDPAAGTQYHPALAEEDWPKFAGPAAALLPRATSAECFPGGAFAAACAQPQALTAGDFVLAGAFLGGAADKTGKITMDLVQYLNRILKITQDTPGTLATLNTLPALVRDEAGVITAAPAGLPAPADERFVDFSAASYLRSDWFSSIVTVLQTGGTGWVPTPVDLMTYLAFANGPLDTVKTNIGGFNAAASDALRSVEFMHEYEIPADLWSRPFATATTVPPVTSPYSAAPTNVTLQAIVTAAGTTVEGGTVTFSVRDALSAPVGTPVSALVSGGTATGTWILPGGTTPQVLTIVAAFVPSGSFEPSSGTGLLTVGLSPTITTVLPVAVPQSSSPTLTTLTASVADANGAPVGEGSLTFTVRDGTGVVIGAPVTAPVVSGAVSAAFTLPGGLPAQRLTVTGAYTGSTLFAPSTGTNFMAVGCVTVNILPTTLPTAIQFRSYTQALTSDGLEPVVFTVNGVLPAGLQLVGSDLTGIPQTTGTFTFGIDAIDFAGCTGTRNYTLTVRNLGASLVTGSGAGMEAVVRLLDGTGQPPADYTGPTELTPYPELTMGVRVAQGDVNGDGTPETITTPGPGGGSRVRVFDGQTGTMLRDFFAFEYYSGGGAYVAAGDVNDDGLADIIVAQGWGAPRVRVYNAVDLSVLYDLSPAELGSAGIRVAVGDVDNDGHADIVLGSGPEAAPVVQVYSGATGTLLRDLTGFEAALPGGVYVAAGDVDGDGQADIVTGVGEGLTPRVRVFSGATLAELRSFPVFAPEFRGGVRVASVDLNGDGKAEVIVGAGPGSAPEVCIFDGATGTMTTSFLVYPAGFEGGVYIGAGR
jgi:hypothetical protein